MLYRTQNQHFFLRTNECHQLKGNKGFKHYMLVNSNLCWVRYTFKVKHLEIPFATFWYFSISWSFTSMLIYMSTLTNFGKRFVDRHTIISCCMVFVFRVFFVSENSSCVVWLWLWKHSNWKLRIIAHQYLEYVHKFRCVGLAQSSVLKKFCLETFQSWSFRWIKSQDQSFQSVFSWCTLIFLKTVYM